MKMIKLILTCTLFLIAFSQLSAQTVKTYEAEWKRVEDLRLKRGLPKSALEEVRKIYAMAKRDKQDAQIIKAVIYIAALQQENREENIKASINEIEKEIELNKEPAASILKSHLATLYWNYFQRNRWQLYNRTNTVNFEKNDIATWTTEDFHKRISALYLESLQNEKLLQQINLAPYDALIIKGNVRHLRPTLYDLLAHKALDYFRNSERDIKKPAYAFTIDNSKAFAPAAEFIKINFATADSLSLHHKALLLYQKLIAFHLNDAKPAALIDVDIHRIQFVYQNAVVENKDELYIKALQSIASKYDKNPSSNQAWFLIAQHHHERASQYQPFGDSTLRYENVKALEILKRVVRDSSEKNEGWVNSYNLLKEIERKEFSFEIEKVNIPAEPFRALVRYKNVEALHFRLVPATNDLKALLQNDDEKYWNALRNANPIRSWRQDLPSTVDYQQHAVEVKVDALPIGEYVLIASPDASFSRGNGFMGAQLFYVSNISYVTRGSKFFVLHRESGQPLANAGVEIFHQEYNYNTSRYTRRKVGDYKTDKNGFFISKKIENPNRGYTLNITHDKDRLFLQDIIYDYYYENQNRIANTEKRIFFFTDRSIYRPGQTVYFKGITIQKNGDKNDIVPRYTSVIYLRDANHQLVDSISLTTNEFGSFNGKFSLPQSGLNGSFFIMDKERRNLISFSVEEYKRPKFYVAFDKVTHTYKVGDSVTVTGSAKGYAGNVIGGANVVYRVVRQPRFMYPWRSWRIWPPQGEPMEIKHGVVTTDKDGNFKITFLAIPDKKINKDLDPVFDYRIYADVTDIAGETRSAEKIVSAGYKSLILKVDLPERIEIDSLNKISIRTENMNGEYQPSTVTVTFSPLLPEQRLIRNRYWEQPDQFVMTKEEFLRHFPNDEYRNESDYKNWPVGAPAYSKRDTTSITSNFNIPNSSLTPGFYKIEIVTKDKDGNEVKDIQFVEIYDPKSNKLNRPEYLWTKGSDPIEPGEKTKVIIGSSASNVFLIHEIDKSKNNSVSENLEFSQLDKEKKSFDYKATEEDRGGFGVGFFFVKNNRFYHYNEVIQVPWTNKELQIEFATFRDKTLPGSEEQWKIKITGYKNEKVAAEMLASMYDASLDQFKPHSWIKPQVWPHYNKRLAWQGIQNFASIQSNQRSFDVDEYRQFNKIYDRFIFDNNMYGGHILEEALQSRASGVVVTSAQAPMDKSRRQMAEVDAANVTSYDMTMADTVSIPPQIVDPSGVDIRKNFAETAFFFPELRTDKDGNIEFTFTAPEALTRWKLQTLSHTKDLAFGFASKEIITQKELMVQPNIPRFVRQGDRIELSGTLSNMSAGVLRGNTELLLFDATSNRSLNAAFKNTSSTKSFSVAAGESDVIKYFIEVPQDFTGVLTWRITAKADASNAGEKGWSDGEEMILPVLSNKMLVTETLPMPVRGTQTKTFNFEKLLKSGSSSTLQHLALTVEYTSNPAWYAVQAIPYLVESANESAEGIWNRYYAASLATKILNAAPRIKQIFERWKTIDTSALLSNLQKNEELKTALLEETPWVLQAQSEEQQKKNIALLFDLVRLRSELRSAIQKLKTFQSSGGGFVWFKGAPDDRYMTQYIVTGIGHLKKLGAIDNEQQSEINSILRTAIPYLDRKLKEDYDNLVKIKAPLDKQQPGYIQIQYLYMRSFFPEVGIPQSVQTAYNYFRRRAFTTWMKQNKYMQGMIALALHRTKDLQTPIDILRSLKETAIVNEEMGMYWQDQRFGYSWFWWHAPIETQALLIEAFTEIGSDTKAVDDMRTWLIKHKQTNNWRTTKATAEACYAFLLQGTDWLTNEPVVQIQLGSIKISNNEVKAEAGTGYFKHRIEGTAVKPEMANITVSVKNNDGVINSPSWGAVYWQYFEVMDKVTSAATPLQLSKKLFIEKNTDRGPVLTPVENGSSLNVGDKIKVRIELRVDRDMEYVHMKDMRASAFEPVNVISGYKWQGGLGYYESTKDISTNFFFSFLRKGTYVFEYPLFVTHSGSFSNGITTIQSFYAPEFSAHSEGVRVTVK